MTCETRDGEPAVAQEPVRPSKGWLKAVKGEGGDNGKEGDEEHAGEDTSRQEDEGSEAGSEEEGTPTQLPNSRTPTRKERELHEATHIPYRSW